MTSAPALLLVALAGVALLIALVAWGRLHAFLALTVVSLLVGLGSGQAPLDVVRAFGEGVAGMLRAIAFVVGFGTVLGRLLAESGGAQLLANTLIRVLGEKRLAWSMLAIGFLVGLPTWFTVGLVLLMPVLLAVRQATGTPLLGPGLPMLGGLALAHCLLPPHPGPMAAIGSLGVALGPVDAGRVVLYATLVAIPVGLCGLPVARGLTRATPLESVRAASAPDPAAPPAPHSPSFALTLGTILLPLGLMLLATAGAMFLPAGHTVRSWLEFAGDPVVAMLAGVLVALWSLGRRCGFPAARLGQFAEESLQPVAAVLLVVGAGGGFSKVLAAGGAGEAMAGLARDAGLSPLLLGWALAAAIRVATGSATVGITMAAGLVVPVAAATPGTNPELLVVAMGAGSMFLSHLNDGGFWFVKELFQLSVAQTLRTWSVLVSVLSLAALGGVMGLNAVFGR